MTSDRFHFSLLYSLHFHGQLFFIRADLMAQWLNNAEPHQQQLWNQLNRQHLLAEHTHLNYILYQVMFR
ncbi:MAG: hypothetical protein D3913_02710 [Candidatus Electrothrix sp. LOE1_4_5]|nr:hypothetical protein [Candidatus Electrothrix gigas]MCI5225595.1 hypothetical protein [Candidatus Electrothrix gigas]